ncbi:YqjF family protein [Oceanobacillus bengalensis]|uniref:DUF2071 domain-containing protein n=1 Tax=Oceanobacillus bengalensis TaxID=1435466 RepID=A0A494YUM3_9BACI|nr:DUF2071 domain-containing protein [Oceanobacillus bengalensis]RKQ13799.1 DUF2071 domain-containing protein [Oceanobacillus bengalensis]
MEIFKFTDHRPFPIQNRRWIMRQSWRNVSFMHWPVSPNLLRPSIPDVLEIDTFHDHAWVSVVIFQMEHIYLRGMPFFSLTPAFSEINLRTYVTYKGIPGIYFLSIDVDHWASYIIAKKWYRLPYKPANISNEQAGETYHYESIRRTQTHVKAEGQITPIADIYFTEKESLDYWLMERYRLYSGHDSKLYKGDIHHPQWPLQKAETQIYKNAHIAELDIGLNEYAPAVAHFSKEMDTVFWQVRKCGTF